MPEVECQGLVAEKNETHSQTSTDTAGNFPAESSCTIFGTAAINKQAGPPSCQMPDRPKSNLCFGVDDSKGLGFYGFPFWRLGSSTFKTGLKPRASQSHPSCEASPLEATLGRIPTQNKTASLQLKLQTRLRLPLSPDSSDPLEQLPVPKPVNP